MKKDFTIKKDDFLELCKILEELSYIAMDWAPDEEPFRAETMNRIDSLLTDYRDIKSRVS